jgi:hypothetical protein
MQVVTIGLLWKYASDTGKIRKSSQDQLEAGERPCLVLKNVTGDMDFLPPRNYDPLLHIKNISLGPAFNVMFALQSGPEDVITGRLGAIGGQSSEETEMLHDNLRGPGREVTINYESQSGVKYVTLLTYHGGKAKDIRYRKVAPIRWTAKPPRALRPARVSTAARFSANPDFSASCFPNRIRPR